MSNPPPFTDSPRESAFSPLQPTQSPLQRTQGMSRLVGVAWLTNRFAPAPNFTDSPGNGNSDKLSTLPPNDRSIRNEPGPIPSSSSSSPSLRGFLSTRPFLASPENRDVRPLTAEGSAQSSSHHRASFESNRASASTPNLSPRAKVNVHPLLREAVLQSARGVDSTTTRMERSSDPTRASSAVRLAGATNSPKKPASEPPSQSRATSPIRFFGWSGLQRNHEDPFIPVNPFQIRSRLRRLSLHSDIQYNLPFDSTCEENPFCCIPSLRCSPEDRFLSFLRDARDFILDTLPRQIYLLLLLSLPSLYFSRIARVYEDAQLSKPDLQRMIQSYSNSGEQQQRQRIVNSSPIPPGAHYHALPFPDEWTTTNVSPALIRFKNSWEAFIDSLLREWKTLNLVSALLLSSVSLSVRV